MWNSVYIWKANQSGNELKCVFGGGVKSGGLGVVTNWNFCIAAIPGYAFQIEQRSCETRMYDCCSGGGVGMNVKISFMPWTSAAVQHLKL